MRWRRLRKWAKWTCTLAAVLAVGLAASSAFWCWQYFTYSKDLLTSWYASAGGGVIWVRAAERPDPYKPVPDHGWQFVRSEAWLWGTSSEMKSRGGGFGWQGGVLYTRYSRIRYYGVSLMYPVLVTTIPAALLWYADRRRFGPGLCGKCGYDRRGLAAEAKCPECGTVPAPASK